MKFIKNCSVGLRGLFAALIAPAAYFRNTDRDSLRGNALYGGSALLIILTGLVFLSALLNMEGLRQVQMDFLRTMKVDPALLPESSLPFSSLAFGLYWVMLLALLGPARHLMLRVLGDGESSLALACWISVHGAVPMILTGGLIAVFNNALPPALPEPGSSGSVWRVVLTSLFAASGLVYEWFVASRGFRQHYNQNNGRAILTALSPWIVVAFLLLLFPRPS